MMIYLVTYLLNTQNVLIYWLSYSKQEEARTTPTTPQRNVERERLNKNDCLNICGQF